MLAAALLPIGMAALGGYEGYKRSGGDIGATALGAGLGALLPGGMRMAGTALAETALGARALGAGNQLLSKAAPALEPIMAKAQGVAIKGGLGPLAPLAVPTLTAAGTGALAGGIGTLVAPALAGGIAAGVSKPVQSIVGGAGAMGVGQNNPSGELISKGGTVPQTGPFGPTGAYGTPYDVLRLDGPFAGARLAQELEQDVQLKGMKKFEPYLFQVAEASKKAEFERMMASAGIRQNIATASNMLQRSQQTAQQMGTTAAQQMGNAITAQYQYQ